MKREECMKKRKYLQRAAGLLLATMLLTSCGEVVLDFPSQEKNAKSAESVLSSEISNEQTVDFQKVFDTLEVPEQFSDSTRYVLINDYDHDGRAEAFGFFGKQVNKDYGTSSIGWQDMQIYYIDADGNINSVHTTEQDDYIAIEGSPIETEKPEDFSECYFETEDNTFAVFEIVYEDDLYYSTIELSSYQGKDTVSWTDAAPQKTEDGKIVVSAWDEEIEYTVEKGCLVEGNVRSLVDEPENSTVETSESSGTIETIWKDCISGSGENALYFLPSDYDGDGLEEAYAITGDMPDEDGYTNHVKIYFIASNNAIFLEKYGLDNGDAIFGLLPERDKIANDPEAVFLKCGNQKFLVWEVSGGGSSSISLVFGVKDGIPYEPAISGKYQWFHQEEDGTYVGTISDFSKGYHDYIDCVFTFNSSTGEFERKQ